MDHRILFDDLKSWTVIHSIFLRDKLTVNFFSTKFEFFRSTALILVCWQIIYERGKPFSLLDGLRFTGKSLVLILPILQFRYLGKTKFFRSARIFQSMSFIASIQCSSQLVQIFHLLDDQALMRKICHHSIPSFDAKTSIPSAD